MPVEQISPVSAIQTSDLEILSQALPPVTAVNAQVVGNPGPATYFYWVVANFSVGNAPPSLAAMIANAPNALSASNYVKIFWQPVPGAASYDLLRTTAPQLPSTPAAIAVGTAIAATSFSDQGAALASYTINTAPIQPELDFEAQGIQGNLVPIGPGQSIGSAAFPWNLFVAALVVSGNIVPAAIGQSLGSLALPWDAFIRNLTLEGTVTGNIIPAAAGQALGSGPFSWDIYAHDLAVSAFVLSNLVPVALGQGLGAVGSEWDAYIRNLELTGSITGNITPVASGQVIGTSALPWDLVSRRNNGVRIATSYPGADIGAQINAAIADLPTVSGMAAGTIFIPSGQYTLSTQVSWTSAFIQFIGVGSGSTIITAAAGFNNDMFRANVVVTYPYRGAAWRGIQLVGNGNANTVGIHISGGWSPIMDDYMFLGFQGTSGAGIWFDESPGTTWTEESIIGGGIISGCTKGIRFSGVNFNSVEYTRVTGLHLRLVTTAAIGISFEGSGVANSLYV
jgi:hypothetical protein